MDKYRSLRIDQDNAAAVEQALSLARQRVAEMNSGEIDEVAGGSSPMDVIHIIVGLVLGD